jgi:AcrR family transcriptional regulator
MRERILRTAAELIAERGYQGTTTRMIADRLKIQQPSLFHHYASKAAIVSALLAWDLDSQLPMVRELAHDRSRSAFQRLREYLRADLYHVMNSPYNLAGVFGGSVMSEPQFAEWRKKLQELRNAVAQIIEDGVVSGEFMPIEPRLGAEMIGGVVLSMLTTYGGKRLDPDIDIYATATVVLRGLLVDPSMLENF